MYAFVVLEKFQGLLIALSIISGITLIITSIFRLPKQWGDSSVTGLRESHQKANKRWWVTALVLFWMFISMAIFVPTKKDVAIIILGGAVGEFVENDDNVKKLPADLFMLLRKELLEEVADLPADFKNSVEEKLGVSLESEADKLGKLSKDELIEMYMKDNEKKTE
jgi:hypothetical protein